jgi:uncharacterized protein YciI
VTYIASQAIETPIRPIDGMFENGFEFGWVAVLAILTHGSNLTMARFAVILEFTEDVEKRLAIRPTHREYLKELLDSGKLVESGPFIDDSGALIVYEVEDLAAAEAQLAADPYTPHGIIAKATIKEWNVVMSALEG